MEFPILFKNVSENYADFYKNDERNSNIIGFVNPDNTNEFGYIISGGRQYGLSYQTLKGYIDTAISDTKTYIIDRMMNYSTEEMRNCSDTSHKANIKAIRVNQTTLKTYLIGSVSIKVSSDNGNSTPAYMIVKISGESTPIAKSINTIKQSDYLNKYVTWYFDTFLISSGTQYDFQLVDSSGTVVTMTPHVAAQYENNDLVCVDPSNYERADFRPAFGVNLSNIYTKDIAVNKTSIEELVQSISNLSASVSNLNALVEHIYAKTGYDKPTNAPTT